MRPKIKDPVKVTLSMDRPVKELGQSLAKVQNKSLTLLIEELIMAAARASNHTEVEITALEVAGKVPGEAVSSGMVDVSVIDLPDTYLDSVVCFEASESSFYPCRFCFKEGQHLLAVGMDSRPGDVVIAQSGDNLTVAEMTDRGQLEPVFREGGVSGHSVAYVVVGVV